MCIQGFIFLVCLTAHLKTVENPLAHPPRGQQVAVYMHIYKNFYIKLCSKPHLEYT